MYAPDDLTAAAAAPLVLDVLVEGECYGYVLLERRRERSEAATDLPDGMLYPLLRRLRRLGYVSDYWAPSSQGHPRRYYRLTPTGRPSGHPARTEAPRTDPSAGCHRLLSSPLPLPQPTRAVWSSPGMGWRDDRGWSDATRRDWRDPGQLARPVLPAQGFLEEEQRQHQRPHQGDDPHDHRCQHPCGQPVDGETPRDQRSHQQ